jgi:hypothetical protein
VRHRRHAGHVDVHVEMRIGEQGDGDVSLGVPVEHDVVERGRRRLIGEGEHQRVRGVGGRLRQSVQGAGGHSHADLGGVSAAVESGVGLDGAVLSPFSGP